MNISLSRYLGSVPENYLFSEVAKRVAAAKNRQPHKKTISLGIGDVTLPLPSCAVRAAVVAAEEMGQGGVVPRLRAGEWLYVLENRGLGALRAAGE